MRLQISKNSIGQYCLGLFIVLLLCEKIYNNTYMSGIYNAYVTIILAISAILLVIFKKYSLVREDFLSIAFIIVLIVYGFSRETIRYGLIFVAILVWGKLEILKLDRLHKLLIIAGVMFSLIDIANGYVRVSGYSSGSSTIFSCTIIISFIYLLFKKEHQRFDYLYAAIAVILIFKTGTASTLILALGLILYKVIINLISKFEVRSWIVKIAVFFGIIVATVILIRYFNNIMSIIPRENREDSTLTRLGLYQTFIKIWFGNIATTLIGHGGGYVQYYINSFWGATSHLPIHQDIIMFGCEYGVLGLLTIYYLFFKKFHMNFIIWLIILLGTFHNIMLAPVSLCLLILTSNLLNLQYGTGRCLWK